MNEHIFGDDHTKLVRVHLKAIAGVSMALLDLIDRGRPGDREVAAHLEEIADLARVGAGKLERRPQSDANYAANDWITGYQDNDQT